MSKQPCTTECPCLTKKVENTNIQIQNIDSVIADQRQRYPVGHHFDIHINNAEAVRDQCLVTLNQPELLTCPMLKAMTRSMDIAIDLLHIAEKHYVERNTPRAGATPNDDPDKPA